jgi:hypothetical protein
MRHMNVCFFFSKLALKLIEKIWKKKKKTKTKIFYYKFSGFFEIDLLFFLVVKNK